MKFFGVTVFVVECREAADKFLETDEAVAIGIIESEHAVIDKVGRWGTDVGVGDEALVEGLTGDGTVEVERVEQVFCCGQALELFVEGFDFGLLDCLSYIRFVIFFRRWIGGLQPQACSPVNLRMTSCGRAGGIRPGFPGYHGV